MAKVLQRVHNPKQRTQRCNKCCVAHFQSIYNTQTYVIHMQRNSLENALSESNKHVETKGFFLQVITCEPNCSSNAPFPFVCLSRARSLALLCKLFRNIKQRPENGCLFLSHFLFGAIHFGWPIAMICDCAELHRECRAYRMRIFLFYTLEHVLFLSSTLFPHSIACQPSFPLSVCVIDKNLVCNSLVHLHST